jgi:hypothetical protein
VIPAGESVLIDTGYPGERDARRVHKAVTEAGLAGTGVQERPV